jgi:hypothetical protein
VEFGKRSTGSAGPDPHGPKSLSGERRTTVPGTQNPRRSGDSTKPSNPAMEFETDASARVTLAGQVLDEELHELLEAGLVVEVRARNRAEVLDVVGEPHELLVKPRLDHVGVAAVRRDHQALRWRHRGACARAVPARGVARQPAPRVGCGDDEHVDVVGAHRLEQRLVAARVLGVVEWQHARPCGEAGDLLGDLALQAVHVDCRTAHATTSVAGGSRLTTTSSPSTQA